VTAGLAELVGIVNAHRREIARTGRLVLQCGHPVLAELRAADPGRAEVFPSPELPDVGTGLSYRAVAIDVVSPMGGHWRLLEDGEVMSEGDVG